ncbi:MAG: CBS domain-containing protein [Candidatus Uhrbacteria bacterium GW2011_GWA2_53_10]|uniref:CBS domain-containing protein n=1 Tax=Candidatus Uhrbacteria bacterium GW2011_GWA2_53_10 TaxID=1618980 RepID=A0A0G1XPG5_9BACT|nr:MAG: CBS domain-containing protein [Candidatus Uhrbacteria bacterium GW2011_GWA2_53_10]
MDKRKTEANEPCYNPYMKGGKEQRKGIMRYADDDRYSVRVLALMRIPTLVFGLGLGIAMSFIVSRFEEVLAQNIALAFFIPFVVYMADAVGAQTRDIYVRDLKSGKASFRTYVAKETVLGLILGVLFGGASWAIVGCWFGFGQLAQTVGLAMGASVGVAPFITLVVAEILELEHQDPAVGAGPIATVILDTVTVIVYGLVASLIFLG